MHEANLLIQTLLVHAHYHWVHQVEVLIEGVRLEKGDKSHFITFLHVKITQFFKFAFK
jgi:hypothetical protein